jgi:hypothetical protein
MRHVDCSAELWVGEKVRNFEPGRQPTLRVERVPVSSDWINSRFKQNHRERHPRIRDAIEPSPEAPDRTDDGGSA